MAMGDYYTSRLDLTTLTSKFSVEVDTTEYPLNLVQRYVFEPSGFVSTTPVWDLTNFPGTSQDSLVSFPTLLNLTNGQYASIEDIPMQYFWFQLNPNLTDSQLDTLIRSIPPLSQGTVYDIRTQYSSIVNQQDTINLIFNIVTVFAMIVSFFSLNTSMYTNIMEQSKEVGILRALGLSKLAIYRIYTYEAFILVLSSAILGVSLPLFEWLKAPVTHPPPPPFLFRV